VGTGLILFRRWRAYWRHDRGIAGSRRYSPPSRPGYPWALAILGTSLFSALGLARRVLGPGARRGPRWTVALCAGLGIGLLTATLLASVAVATTWRSPGSPPVVAVWPDRPDADPAPL